MDIDYYIQDLENGGYKLAESLNLAKKSYPHPMSFNAHHDVGWPYPQEQLVRALKSMKIFGGYQKCEYVGYVPKLSPLMMLDYKLRITVAGHRLYVGRLVRVGQNFMRNFQSSIKKIVRGIKNLDKEGYLIDPVDRNTDREEWVEKAMWEMGFSRSNYRPSIKPTQIVNVGTVGHCDHDRAPWKIILESPQSFSYRKVKDDN